MKLHDTVYSYVSLTILMFFGFITWPPFVASHISAKSGQVKKLKNIVRLT